MKRLLDSKLPGGKEEVDMNRGISFMIDYVLTIGILLGILVLLVGTFGSNVDENEQATIEYESEQTAADLASAIMDVDAMVESNSSTTNANVQDISVRVHMPRTTESTRPQLRQRKDGGEEKIIFVGRDFEVALEYETANEVVLLGATTAEIVTVEWDSDRDQIVISSQAIPNQ